MDERRAIKVLLLSVIIARAYRGTRVSMIEGRESMATLLPIMAAVSAGFLVIGLALPVLPLHVHDGLGFGPFVVGLVTGSQFIASLLSRVWAGSYADTRAGKSAVVIGLVTAALAGLVYLASFALLGRPAASAAILLFGRAVLGMAESFIITGGVAWGLALADDRHSGKIIGWIGTAMFAALALGAPIGSTLYAAGGFSAIALATAVLPAATLLAIVPMHGAAGLMLIWFAPGPMLAAAGAALTGLGYSLVYPGLGAEAIRNLPASSRGLAMGLYTVFLDVALGFGSPALGLIAASATLDSVFLASAVIVSCATVIALGLSRKSSGVAYQSRDRA